MTLAAVPVCGDNLPLVAEAPVCPAKLCQSILEAVLSEAREKQRVRDAMDGLQLASTAQWASSSVAQSFRVLISQIGTCKIEKAGASLLLCLGQVVLVVVRRVWLLCFRRGDICTTGHLAALCKETLSAIGSSVTMEALWNGLHWVLEKVVAALNSPAVQLTGSALKYLAAGGFAVLVLRAIIIMAGERRFLTIDEALQEFLSGVIATLPAACVAVIPVAGPAAFAIGMLLAATLWGFQHWMSTVPKDKTAVFGARIPGPVHLPRQSFWAALMTAFTGRQAMPMEWNIPLDREIQLDLDKNAPDMLCPISRSVIVDPVVLNGFLYERDMITSQIIARGKDAMGERCSLAQLRPSPAAALAIQDWARSEGLALRPRRS